MVIKVEKYRLMCQNVEVFLSKILRDNRQRRLEKVEFEDGNLFLTFSDEDNCEVKTVVKQYSKKKYKDIISCVYKFEDGNTCKYYAARTIWQVKGVVELPKIWLIFFERNFQNN